jgi:hypothetical protein
LNFDTEAAFKTRYKTPVRSVILLFKNGKEVERITADGDPGVIEALLKKGI